MPLVLRQIRQARWLPDPSVQPDDVQADAFLDLQTGENKLSVWIVADDRSNLNRIIAALAANRDRISNLDYALLSDADVERLNIRLSHEPGVSPDDSVNTHWHRDLIGLTGRKLLGLALAIQIRGERKRVTEKDVLQLLAKAVVNGDIDPNRAKLKSQDMQRLQDAASGLPR